MVSSSPRASSVGQRLTLITVLASALALTVALGSITVSESIAFRRALRADVGTLADLVSANSAGALVFDDQNNAEETLRLAALPAQRRRRRRLQPARCPRRGLRQDRRASRPKT